MGGGLERRGRQGVAQIWLVESGDPKTGRRRIVAEPAE
jgi:hypothetical protein